MGPLPHDGEVKCSGKMAPEDMENLSMKKEHSPPTPVSRRRAVDNRRVTEVWLRVPPLKVPRDIY